MKIVVVDDMEESRQWLAQKIEEYMQRRSLRYDFIAFESGEAFVAALEREVFDIVFMDIFMDGMNGIDTARKLREQDMDCKLVFLTNSPEYMDAGYAFMPRHYLLKPVKDADFQQAMANCQIKRQLEVPFLSVISGRIPLCVDTEELMYVDVCDRITALHLEDRVITISGSMGTVSQSLLADKRFMQCIKGVLVNMDYIKAVEDNFFLLKNEEKLQMTTRSKAALVQHYRTYVFTRMEERKKGK